MRILIIHNTYIYPGGEDQVVEAEKNLLQAHGNDVYIYTRSNATVEPWGFFFSWKTYWDVKGIIKAFKPDIVHVHNTFYTVSPSIFVVCRALSLPVVMTLHNYRFICPKATFFRDGSICRECTTENRSPAILNRCFKDSGVQTRLLNLLIKKYFTDGLMTRNVRYFIAASEFSRREFINAGWPEEKVILKPHFIAADPGEGLKKEHYALYVGALQDYKGIITLIETWKRYKIDCPLRIIGSGPLRDQITAMVQGTRIELLGQKSYPQVIEYMQKALFLVMPSTCYETFARVIMEAYACATPVIASNHGAMQELVQDQVTGYVFKPGNSEDLYAKVALMLGNSQQTREMGKNARVVYQQQFTAGQNYWALNTIYEKAMTL